MFRQTMLAAARIPLVHCMREMVLFSKSFSENCVAAPQPLPALQSARFPPLTKLHLKYPEIQRKSWKVWRSTPNISMLFQVRWLCRTRHTTTVCPFFPGFSLRHDFPQSWELLWECHSSALGGGPSLVFLGASFFVIGVHG